MEEQRCRMYGSARAVARAHDAITTALWDTVGVLCFSRMCRPVETQHNILGLPKLWVKC